MPSPLSAEDDLLLETVWSLIATWQRKNSRPVQRLVKADFEEAGVPPSVTARATALLVKASVDVYDPPSGVRGFVFRVSAPNAGGKKIGREFQFGEETWRARDWREIPVPPTSGPAIQYEYPVPPQPTPLTPDALAEINRRVYGWGG